MRTDETYRIGMDGRWQVQDLSTFARALSQAYAFSYCFSSTIPPTSRAHVTKTLRNYPWMGGFSVVNLYKKLQRTIPQDHNLQIAKISYASPGWIDVVAHAESMLKVALAVGTILGTPVLAARSCARIYKLILEMRLDGKRAALEGAELDTKLIKQLRSHNVELGRLLKVSQLGDLQSAAPDEVVIAKVLMAQFRRLKIVADYEKRGLVSLPIPEGDLEREDD